MTDPHSINDCDFHRSAMVEAGAKASNLALKSSKFNQRGTQFPYFLRFLYFRDT